MGFKIKSPHVVAFLEWLRVQYPDERNFLRMSSATLQDAAARFAGKSPFETGISISGISEVIEYSQSPLAAGWGARQDNEPAYDLLERYLKTPFRAIFLFSGQDLVFGEHMHRFWDSMSDESGTLFDFYDYTRESCVDSNSRIPTRGYSYTESFIKALDPIPGAKLASIRAVGLPCMLIWSNDSNVLVPFSDVAEDHAGIKERFRFVVSCLNAGSIDRLKLTFDPQVVAREQASSDVFISYRHSDRQWVSALCDQLSEASVSVWYDQHIRAGERWDYAIQHHLARAKAVVVVWSKLAVASRFVQAEALFAYSKGRLAPTVKEQGIDLPVPFNTVQYLDMSNWSPGKKTKEFGDLLQTIGELKRV